MKTEFRIMKSTVDKLLGKSFTLDLENTSGMVDLGNHIPHMKFRIKQIRGNLITLTNEHITLVGEKQ